jgi:large subunit ribosomal protein L21
MTQTYAIVETGGKQYKVSPGQTIEVDRLPAAEGETVELSRVLLISDDGDAIIGTPTVEGAKVTATCLGEKKGNKIIVFKYKAKTRYRRKKGHRQLYTTLRIEDIVKPGKPAEATKRATRRTRTSAKKQTTSGGEG